MLKHQLSVANLSRRAQLVEQGVAVRSVALVGFGLDSVIELAAAAVTLWRLNVQARGADAESVERTERTVRRDWRKAKAFLTQCLAAPATAGETLC